MEEWDFNKNVQIHFPPDNHWPSQLQSVEDTTACKYCTVFTHVNTVQYLHAVVSSTDWSSAADML